MAQLRPLTKEELLRTAGAMNPAPTAADVQAHVAATQPIQPGSPEAAQMSHQQPGTGAGVPVEDIRPPEKAKPAAAPRKVASSGPPSRGGARGQPPGPAPTAVLASNGVMPAAPAAQPQAAPAAPGQAPDFSDDNTPPFWYADAVRAAEEQAMSLGRVDDAAAIRQNYNSFIDGQFRTLETEYETKTLPKVQQIRTAMLNNQLDQLPAQFAAEARSTVMQAAQQQQQMLAFMYGLVRNDATRGLGVKYFNESKLLEPGVQVNDFIVDGDRVVGIDNQGKVVKLSSGQDFALPVEDLEGLYNQFYGPQRRDNMIVPKGSVAVSNGGQVIFDNRQPDDGTDAEGNSRIAADVKTGTFALARALNLELDATGKMMAGVDPQTNQTWLTLSAEVEKAIRAGMPPQQAALEVFRRYQGGQAAAGMGTGPSMQELMGGSN